MKPEEAVVMIVDWGSYEWLAEDLAKSFRKTYYCTTPQGEFFDLQRFCKGTGIPGVEWVEEVFSPETLAEVDLYIFPDIGFAETQRTLRSMGKLVWGSIGAYEIELSRTGFLKMLKEIGLPQIPSRTVKGLTNLRAYLKQVESKWVKCDTWRGNCETFKHIDYAHSLSELDRLAHQFGGLQEEVVFVVQDNTEATAEIGYDGWTVDGQFPQSTFQGYELKNELYLGSMLKWDELPDAIRTINERLAPILKEHGYRNFIATEIRVTDQGDMFIDPTMRMPGQTGEQLGCTCRNLAAVIWEGSQGNIIDPQWAAKFAAAATLHYKGGGEGGMVLRIPGKVREYVKLYHYCQRGDEFHFPPKDNGEVGVVIGTGNTIKEAIAACNANLDLLKDEPVYAETERFTDILKDVHEAQEQDIHFTDQRIPKPEEVLAA